MMDRGEGFCNLDRLSQICSCSEDRLVQNTSTKISINNQLEPGSSGLIFFDNNHYDHRNNLDNLDNLDNLHHLGNLGNLVNLDNLDNVSNLDKLGNLDKLDNLDKFGNLDKLDNLDKFGNLGNLYNLDIDCILDNLDLSCLQVILTGCSAHRGGITMRIPEKITIIK